MGKSWTKWPKTKFEKLMRILTMESKKVGATRRSVLRFIHTLLLRYSGECIMTVIARAVRVGASRDLLKPFFQMAR